MKRMEMNMVMEIIDGYYVAYELTILPCIMCMVIEMKLICYPSYAMFAMKSMNICND